MYIFFLLVYCKNKKKSLGAGVKRTDNVLLNALVVACAHTLHAERKNIYLNGMGYGIYFLYVLK